MHRLPQTVILILILILFLFLILKPMFSHEKLHAYQKALSFVAWTQPLIESLPGKVSARDQLERASTSIVLNIAEGHAKFSTADRARFIQITHGSAVECAACLDVLVARRLKNVDEVKFGKQELEVVVRLLLGLLDYLGCRVAEESPLPYGSEVA